VDIRLVWPGKTKNAALRDLQTLYLAKIGRLNPCEVVETAEARGVAERFEERILEIEARGLEKRFKDDYIVCLFDRGQQMSSVEFARFFEKLSARSVRTVAFVVGGFLGLAPRILDRADLRLSLSRMTFSHETCRVMLMEQIYRSLSMSKGRAYAK